MLEILKWKQEQKKYLLSIDEGHIKALIIYSQGHIFYLINKFCIQSLTIDDIFKYDIYKDIKEVFEFILYLYNKKGNNSNIEDIKKQFPRASKTREYVYYILDLIISIINTLIKIILNAPKIPKTTLYRGTKSNYFTKDGKEFINYGFMSTSIEEEISKRFRNKFCCTFKIDIENASCVYLSGLSDIGYNLNFYEQEVLLPPYSGIQFKKTKNRLFGIYEYEYIDYYDKYYNQFNIYKDIILNCYFDKDISSMINLIINNPININKDFIKLLYKSDILTSEVFEAVLQKNPKIEVDYILYALDINIEFRTLKKLIDNFKEFGDKLKINRIISKGIKENKVEFINYLNLAYGEYVITPTQSVLSTLRKIGDSLIGSE